MSVSGNAATIHIRPVAAILLAFTASAAAQTLDKPPSAAMPSEVEMLQLLNPAPLTREIRPGARGIVAAERPMGRLVLNVTFEYNSAKLTDAARELLDRLGRVIGNDQLADRRFVIEGHTDARGSDAYNMTLSIRRADAVSHYLIDRHGVTPNRLRAEGRGETALLDPAHPDSGVNRRVEVKSFAE
jgi:outer membrane protein OmpA-like peptidoglycan-associated protein